MNNTALQNNFQKYIRRKSLWLQQRQLGYGALVLAIILAGLSVLANLNLAPEVQYFVAGEIATTDVVADHAFMFEDASATRAKKDQVRATQPLICDITPEQVPTVREKVKQLLASINAASSADVREKLRSQFAEDSGDEIPSRIFLSLGQDETQSIILNHVLPFLEQKLQLGVIADTRLLASHKSGILVRDPQNGTEVLYSDPQALTDIKTLNAELAQLVKGLNQGSVINKRAAVALTSSLVSPTLSPNIELTKSRADDLVQGVEPVQVQVQKGELIVRQGERVTKDQQIKIQSLRQRKNDRFKLTAFFGTFVTSLLISSGLFFSPSGKPTSPVRQKDIIFIGVLVALVSVMAKGLLLIGQRLAETDPAFPADSLAYMVPVAGIAAIAALVFATRRYVVTGLLLAFFGSLMFKASLGLFIFYFLGAMWNTWLIVRTQSRQNVVVSLLPLLLALFVMWVGVTFIQGGLHTRYLPEVIAVLAGGVISLFMVFSLAPLVEIIFGYSTRFRLMELINLDQPILRELMINAPGTYHHSLIVAHLVEAGASAIGAQSLLCKVAALYHDIGKITRPDYFIENQFNRDNPHDRLAPSMSALILTAHVKKGVELAQAHRLGIEVTDIISQHHGTNIIQYFFKRAQDLGENPKLADYSYPGPKPQSREAAIVMLADAVEASSRSLDDPTPSRLQTHIDAIIKGTFANGQLDESDLTFKDLDKLAQSFVRVLTGLFHHRIKYPDKLPLKPALQAELDKVRVIRNQAETDRNGDNATTSSQQETQADAKLPVTGKGTLPPLQ